MTNGIAKRFDGKVVLVTGGNSGIGRAAALKFAAEGAHVVIAARREAEGREAVAEIESAGGTAMFIQTDVTDEAQVQAMVDGAVEAYGRLDHAFNNAGISASPGALHLSERSEWDTMMGVNLLGVWLCMKYEIAQMLGQGRAAGDGGYAIVNDSSTAGLAGYARNPIYAASKHGVVGLTSSVALQYADQGIRVNAVCPGWTLTSMAETALSRDPRVGEQAMWETPLARWATPEEIADAVLWLSSDASSFVTGHSLPVDGGLLAS